MIFEQGKTQTTEEGRGLIMSLNGRLYRTLQSIVLLVALSPLGVIGQTVAHHREPTQQLTMKDLTDEQIIQALGSQNQEESHQAAREILARGERMIPLLLCCKGDQRPFYG